MPLQKINIATSSRTTLCGVRTGIELDELCDLAGLQVDADGVVHLDEGVGVADGASIMGHQVGDSLGADDDLLHLAQLVLQRRKRRAMFNIPVIDLRWYIYLSL